MGKIDMVGPVEISGMTAIPVRTITRLAKQGIIPAVKVGRQWRFIKQDVEVWLKTTASNKKRRVMVVDDDIVICRTLGRIIESVGAIVVMAEGGRKAMDILEIDQDFDLIFLDLLMDDMDGPELMRRMKEKGIDVDVVIMTGYPDSDLMARALKYRHMMVVPKPVDPAVIQRVVENALVGKTAGTWDMG